MTDEEKAKTDEAIKKRIEGIFPSPEVASQVINMVVSERPPGWSKHSNAPYYKKIYADQLKPQIDKMIETGNSIIFYYSRWCNDETMMSRDTLYQRINQSLMYILVKMDPDKKYAQWRERVDIHRNHPAVKGILIEYVPGLSNVPSEQFIGEEVSPRADLPSWRKRMDVWLESDSMDPFVQEKLILTPDEVVTLKKELAGMSHIQAFVSPTTIKIVKMNVN